MFLSEKSRSREEVLAELGMGLRTFYRELDLLKRCGVRVALSNKAYRLTSTAEQAEGRLPFPDPQLSFAEMAELARCAGEAGQRLAEMLAAVIDHPPPPKRRRGRSAAPSKSKKR
jgi:hypothetical protein